MHSFLGLHVPPSTLAIARLMTTISVPRKRQLPEFAVPQQIFPQTPSGAVDRG